MLTRMQTTATNMLRYCILDTVSIEVQIRVCLATYKIRQSIGNEVVVLYCIVLCQISIGLER